MMNDVAHHLLSSAAITMPDEVVVRVSTNLESSQSASWSTRHVVVIGGTIGESQIPKWSTGTRVVAYLEHALPKDSAPLQSLLKISPSRLGEQPSSMSSEDAVEYATSLLKAAAIITGELKLPLETLKEPHASFDPFGGKRIFVVGGQTTLATALVQILKRISPGCKIAATTTMVDQDALFQRTIHLVMLGAGYAIDGDAVDLMQHLRADMVEHERFDMILDTVGRLGGRAELLDLLAESGTYVDCTATDFEAHTRSLLPELADVVVVFNSLLKQAADVFDTRTEPSCPLE